LGRRQRTEALIFHHAFLSSTAKAGAAALWRKPFLLWQADDIEGHRHQVILQRAALAPMEGESELYLSLDGQRLFTLTFTIVSGKIIGEEDVPILLIGGLQGAYMAREKLRYAARATGEIAGPALLLSAASTIAEIMGIDILAGPSNKTQIAKEYTVDGRSTSLNYDRLWNDANGHQNALSFFILSPAGARSQDALISGNHRSRTRRRRVLRAALRAEMLKNIKVALA
jgi:uncharacterized protein VirK/YbjX